MKKGDLYTYLKEKGSPLAPFTGAIFKSANKYRIDPRLIVAIAGAESSFGEHLSGEFNAWGIGPGRSYKSWQDGINAAAKLLREGYVGEGLTTLRQIQTKWAPIAASNDPTNLNSNWLRNTSSIYAELGGNANTVNTGFRSDISPADKENTEVEIPDSVTENMGEYPEFYTPGEGVPEDVGYLPTMMDVATGHSDPTELLAAEGQRTSMELEEALKPEPPPESAPGQATPSAAPGAGTPTDTSTAPGPAGKVDHLPLGTKLSGGSEFNVSDPEGAPSKSGGSYHSAKDWFSPGGSAVFSPEAGKIVEVKKSSGNSGQVFGGTVKIQTGDGRVWVFRHVNPLSFRVGQKVTPGQRVASVVRWADNPGSSHAHIELWKTLGGGYVHENMIDPMTWFRK